MIKELIFSGKKFWQAEDEPFIGKTMKPLKNNITVYNAFNSRPEYETTAYFHAPIKIEGEAKDPDGGTWILVEGGTWISLNTILQNGGVSSSPLTQLYQAIRHFFDRKVALA